MIDGWRSQRAYNLADMGTDGTGGGGAAELGTLYAADVSGAVHVLHSFEGSDGRLARIVFARGPALDRHALFFNTGQTQQSTLAAQLGCQFTGSGHVRCDRKGRTGVPHLFIAGDANGDVQFVVVAAAEGAEAAVAINKELQADDCAAAGIQV